MPKYCAKLVDYLLVRGVRLCGGFPATIVKLWSVVHTYSDNLIVFNIVISREQHSYSHYPLRVFHLLDSWLYPLSTPLTITNTGLKG